MEYATKLAEQGGDDDRHGIYNYLLGEQSRYSEIDDLFDTCAEEVCNVVDTAYSS